MCVKEYTLAIFLGIKGAFNDVDPDSIVRALGSLNLGQNLISYIAFLLKSMIITSKVGAMDFQRMVHRGTPKGGVLSPLP